jgi:capsular exopolysaccharide synthesis family protein
MPSLIKQSDIGAEVHDSKCHVIEAPWQRETVDLRQLANIFLKRKWQILSITLAVLIPTLVITLLTTPEYRSIVTIQIDPETVKVLPYREVSEPLNAPYNYELYMKTQDQILKSPTLAERTIQRLEEESAGEETYRLAGSFVDSFEVQRVHESQVIRLGYSSPDPLFSARVANTAAEEFIKLHLEKKRETTERARKFLEDQLNTLRQRLEDAEAQLIRYARDHNILDVENRQHNLIRQRLDHLTAELSKVESEYIALKAEYEAIRSATADQFPQSLDNPLIARLETRQTELEQTLAQLLSQFGENWPAVIKTRNELSVVKAQLDEERSAALTQAKRQAQMEFNKAREGYRTLARSLDRQKQLVNQLNEASVEYNILEREVDTNEQLYQGLLQRLKETGVTAGLEFGNIQIIDRARPDYIPFRPQPKRNLALALLVGLSLGIGLAFLREYLDDTVKKPDDIEALGLPSLGLIPTISQLASDGSPPKRAMVSAIQSAVRIPGISEDQKRSQWRVQEAFRSFCSSILLSKAGRPAQRILVTSAGPLEGKTTTVACLGMTLAETGVPTLVVDADFRKPTLAKHFGVPEDAGLSVFLAGFDRFRVERTSHPNLFVLPPGPAPPNPVALLNSERFIKTLDSLSERFKFILIDSPPVLTVTDASILASKVDGIILVVQAGKTPKDIVNKARVQLARAGAFILGGVINQVDLNSPDYSYYNQYYYSESYSPEEDDSSLPGSGLVEYQTENKNESWIRQKLNLSGYWKLR